VPGQELRRRFDAEPVAQGGHEVPAVVGDDDARTRGGTAATVPDGSEVMVIPAMAGGSA